MAEALGIPPIFEEAGIVPEHYGLAYLLEPTDDYAARPFGQAFTNLEIIAPFFAKLTPSQRRSYDVTAFYSERRPDLTDEQVASLEVHDLWAFAAALGMDNPALTGKLDSYFRGEKIDTNGVNEAPYPGMDFRPNCMSSCFIPEELFAKMSTNSEYHRSVMRYLREWFAGYAIAKLRPVFINNADGNGSHLDFELRDIRSWNFNHDD